MPEAIKRARKESREWREQVQSGQIKISPLSSIKQSSDIVNESIINDIEKTKERVSSIAYATNVELIRFRKQFYQPGGFYFLEKVEHYNEKTSQRVQANIEIIDNLVETLEALTHKKEATEKDLEHIYNIISLVKNLTEELASVIIVFSKHLARKEAECYMEKIAILDEVVEDVDNVFFLYPTDVDFQKAAKELSKVE